MTRFPKSPLLPLALAATTVLFAGCGADSSSTMSLADGAAFPNRAWSPIELNEIGAGTPLAPGTYAMPLVGDSGPRRAVVEVPDGYFSAGGWIIDDDHGELAPDEYGNLAFYAAVDLVDRDPCHTGSVLRPGPGVSDLADALSAQRHRATAAPVPISLGGYDGLYVESRPSGGFDGCDGREHTLLRAHADDSMWLRDDTRGTVDRLWILDVNGRRVVAVAQTMGGRTAHAAELVGIAESVDFLHLGIVVQPFRPGP